ncbi:MAG: phosphoribosylamine--glycine ligase [Sphingomonadaceae bacterium]|nr:phosphoribosylamine--glycine ligase [Sphingomonadaceae bacterium]
MRVLLIGGGGREHALALALGRSPTLGALWISPGNAGTAAVGHNVPAMDAAATVAFARGNGVDLVVIGPEAPLAAGLADALRAAGIATFGPSAAAARLESSKGFTKDLCARAGIPTAAFARFDAVQPALSWLAGRPVPIVVKADGLMAGKGVIVASTRAEAEAAVCELGAHGPLVIEEFLEGEEASLFALVAGGRAVTFGTARDYKRVGDGDRGPNTGGMGSVSPAPALTPELAARAMREIVEPTVAALAAAGTRFEGFLYAGLMLTAAGPKLIEYNVRLGDPEAQSLLARFEGDLVQLLADAARGVPPPAPPRLTDGYAVTVVIAARGYPGAPALGGTVGGLAAVEKGGPQTGPVTVHHAGTALDANGRVVASGGRVLGVTALRASAADARAAVYAALERLDYADAVWRGDIGAGSMAPTPSTATMSAGTGSGTARVPGVAAFDSASLRGSADGASATPRILFVCLGNICRSPLAEGVFRARAAEAGLNVEADSAGTGDWHLGRPPDLRAQAIARANGVALEHLRARRVTPRDFYSFTHILAMDGSNLANLSALRPPDATAHLGLFMDFAPEEGTSVVPDPYYGGPDDFARTFRLVDAAARGLVARLQMR